MYLERKIILGMQTKPIQVMGLHGCCSRPSLEDGVFYKDNVTHCTSCGTITKYIGIINMNMKVGTSKPSIIQKIVFTIKRVFKKC